MADRDMIGADPAFCAEDIGKADFVAIRVDSSEYLFNDVKKSNLSLEEYFKAHVQRMEEPPVFGLPQRLGVCCGVWHPLKRCFDLSSYDLGLFPGFFVQGLKGTQREPARRFIHGKAMFTMGTGAPAEPPGRG
eukprot:Skav223376  [mRNA]  locus=scaffold2634:83968:89001:+ [translate_table: standard]